LYPDRPCVEETVESLKQPIFRNTDISVLLPHKNWTEDFALENTTGPEAIAGAGSGAVLSGALGQVARIGMLDIPASATAITRTGQDRKARVGQPRRPAT